MNQELNLTAAQRQLFGQISELSKDTGTEVYVVGGFVRDLLLDRSSPDLDFVCVGDALEFAQRFAKSLSPEPEVIVYKKFGTAMLRYGELELEFVTARAESYQPDSRKPSVRPGTLQEDQLRRDFTINALALSLSSASFLELVDPFGGLKDLKHRRIVTPADPDITFSDDPLRMMRAVRFASQLDFEIDEETLEAITRNAQRLDIISKERIISELNKIVLSPKPSIGFSLLYDTNLLHQFFPEMVALQGIEVRKGMGHKDVFYHTLQVLDNLSMHTDDLWLRWSAIMHDIAKPPTKRFDDKVGWTYHGHEVVGARMVKGIFRRLKLPMDDRMKYVQKLVRLHLRPIAMSKDEVSDSGLRRLLFDAGEDIDDLLMLCRADITTKSDYRRKRYLSNYEIVQRKLIEIEEKDALRNWQPPIDGAEIMRTFDLKPSREVGLIKDAIREGILDGDIDNNYEAARNFMISKAQELGLSPTD